MKMYALYFSETLGFAYRTTIKVRVNSPVTGSEWPTGFQEVNVPRFRDNGKGWW